jgi:hypothetical protein
MTAHVYRPGYIDITEHAASLFDDLGLTVDQQTWFLHFVAHYPLDEHADTLITPWLRTFGDEESISDFLFQFFYSRTSNIAAWAASGRQFAILRDIIVSPSGGFAEEFQRVFGIAISNAGISRYDWALVHGDISDEDWALVVLFELCFPDTSDALIPWLRADGSTDPFHLGELLQLGVDAKSVRRALESDVDTTLMSSVLSGNAGEVTP